MGFNPLTYEQKLTMEDQNKPFTTTRGHAGQIVGRKNSEKVRMRKKKGSLVTGTFQNQIFQK